MLKKRISLCLNSCLTMFGNETTDGILEDLLPDLDQGSLVQRGSVGQTET